MEEERRREEERAAAARAAASSKPSATVGKTPLPAAAKGVPPAVSKPATNSPFPTRSAAPASSKSNNPEFDKFKQEVMAAFREELARWKQDLIAEIGSGLR